MYASVIVDLSLEKLDHIFSYSIPPELEAEIHPGVKVDISFGKGGRRTTGYVVDITKEAGIDPNLVKPILSVSDKSLSATSELLMLASFLRRFYGGTMIAAIKTVLPVRRSVKSISYRTVKLSCDPTLLEEAIADSKKRGFAVKAGVLEALKAEGELDERVLRNRFSASKALIDSLNRQGIVAVSEEREWRDPMREMLKNAGHSEDIRLNDAQLGIVESIEHNRDKNHLIKGITGSGKTLIYIELAARAAARGKKTIILIPEIALTFQTLLRFYGRFGDRISIIHSKLSEGERFEQFERAKKGETDVMIGPRSALFTPFEGIDYIIIDEEQETSYKSENVPRYHAREVAMERGRLSKASVILGSATPSVDAYYMAKTGQLMLHEISFRATGSALAKVNIVDLREELRAGNRSMLSRPLFAAIDDRLKKNEQIMLFLNRRGLSGVVACRNCGSVVKCPHCDVSMSLHNDGKLKCHYCGYETANTGVCPVCSSKLIGTFKSGTQKVEQYVLANFPKARVLRMDYDTTRQKGGYERILSAFAAHEADILIGTQMIVKGHDFPLVTLVGVLAADMSLAVPEFTASERTFSLLTQAAGRSGRGSIPGEVYIQTYQPENYVVKTAAAQDYESFYAREIEYRKRLSYPPTAHLLMIFISSEDEDAAEKTANATASYIRSLKYDAAVIGPSKATVYKVNDSYRRQVFVKASSHELLADVKDMAETFIRTSEDYKKILVIFDFS